MKVSRIDLSRLGIVVGIPDPLPEETCHDFNVKCSLLPRPGDSDARWAWAECWQKNPNRGTCPFLD